MKKLTSLAIAATLLAACATSTPTDPTTTSLVTGVQNFETAINQGIAQVNSGIAASQPLFQLACGGASYLDALFKIAAPLAGASTADTQNEQAAMAGLNSLCAAPPTDIASATSQALAGYVAVKASLASAAPAVAAQALTPPS